MVIKMDIVNDNIVILLLILIVGSLFFYFMWMTQFQPMYDEAQFCFDHGGESYSMRWGCEFIYEPEETLIIKTEYCKVIRYNNAFYFDDECEYIAGGGKRG